MPEETFMNASSVLLKAKNDILKLKNDSNQGNTILIQYILNVVKSKCGVYLANQLVKELALEEQYLTNTEILN